MKLKIGHDINKNFLGVKTTGDLNELTNFREAEDLFNKLSQDIKMYIKKRWPIK